MIKMVPKSFMTNKEYRIHKGMFITLIEGIYVVACNNGTSWVMNKFEHYHQAMNWLENREVEHE